MGEMYNFSIKIYCAQGLARIIAYLWTIMAALMSRNATANSIILHVTVLAKQSDRRCNQLQPFYFFLTLNIQQR